MKKNLKMIDLSLSNYLRGVMALCLQALVPKTNWLGVIDILLVTQTKLSLEKIKIKRNKRLGNSTLFYLELG